MGHQLEDYTQDVLVQMYNLATTDDPEEIEEVEALEFIHDRCIDMMYEKISLVQALDLIHAEGRKAREQNLEIREATLAIHYWGLYGFLPKEIVEKLDEPFAITSVCRGDMINADTLSHPLTLEQALTIENHTMDHIAGKMADVYVENGFWDVLDVHNQNILEEIEHTPE